MFEIDLHNQAPERRPRRRLPEPCIAATWLNQKPTPQLPIQTLAGISVTHNRAYDSFARFVEAINEFFDRTIPKDVEEISDAVTDNFRVITHEKYSPIG